MKFQIITRVIIHETVTVEASDEQTARENAIEQIAAKHEHQLTEIEVVDSFETN